MIIGDNFYITGLPVSCYINSTYIEGAIYVKGDRCWICHNERDFNGGEAPSRLGFRYSWCFNPSDSSSDVSRLKPLKDTGSNFKSTSIDEQIRFILEELIAPEKLLNAFFRQIKPFENYTEVLKSSKLGYIILRGAFMNEGKTTYKRVEIKLSRYLKRISDSFVSIKASCGEVVDPIFTDLEIETIYNKFTGILNGDSFKLEFLTGDDIGIGYTSTNYAKQTGTLVKSCMSNKLDYLDIYRKNKNCSLAVLKHTDLISARCLIWKANGIKYFDRIYHTADWIEQAMRKKLLDSGHREIFGIDELVEINLESNEFDYYPYIDTFRYQLEGTNRFFNFLSDEAPSGIYLAYGSTSGGFQRCQHQTSED